MRWMLAAAGSLALAAMTAKAPLFDAAPRGADGVCDANAKAAPLNFTLKDMQNRDVKLASFKGKVLVIDFWATWCGPCKIEIPWFIDFQKKYGGQGLQFVGILTEDKVEELKPFVDQYKINYPILLGLGHEGEAVQDAFGPIWGLPTTFVIGRDGKICRKHPGVAGKDTFEREIKSLL